MAKKSLLVATKFDYSALDKDTRGKLVWYAGQICKQGAAHVKAGLEMGRMLSEARELCGEKPFPKWVEAECGCSLSTAYNYISAFEHFGDFPTVGKIELGAMYTLSTSPPAKKKALKLAEKGVTVTQSVAKKLVAESKPKPPPDSPDDAPEPEDEAEPDSEPETPQTDAQGTEPADYGKCPACAGTKWTDTHDGVVCSKCGQYWGEPAGDVDPPKRPPKPPKKLDKPAYYKQWDQNIGPLVRLVSTIADGVGEKNGQDHKAVKKHLNDATKAVMKWMGVKK